MSDVLTPHGQTSLLPKPRFCPRIHCRRPCGPDTCECRPCACARCTRPRRSWPGGSVAVTPDLIAALRAPRFHQRSLFLGEGATTKEESVKLPFRQGDVIVVPIDTIPDGLVEVPRDNGRIVLAYGEVTGHAHVLEGEACLLAADVADLEERFLRVEKDARLVHDEHDTIDVPKGDYIVRRQREYAPEANTLVAD